MKDKVETGMPNNEILKINNLKVSFNTHLGEVKAVRDISFGVKKSEVVGIVGESGSGKTVTALSIMRLLNQADRGINGEIFFKGHDILKKTKKEMQRVRGSEIAMIFQDPAAALNPVFTIGNQIQETILQHQKMSKKAAKNKTIELLKKVGIDATEKGIRHYPYELSGGMCQRVMIAMALSCEPTLLIADEPTSALDVTNQAQILELLKDENIRNETSILLITHDLNVIAKVCSKVIVMYGGLIMEQGTVKDIFHNTKHPYTKGLLKSLPQVTQMRTKERLIPIEGSPPDLISPPKGCPFMPRCSYAMKICEKYQAPSFEINDHHKSMCWRLHEEAPIAETWLRRSVGND